MARLIYLMNVSLDGYIEDGNGDFNWSAPSDEVFSFITKIVASAGTFLYGRRLYETMVYWETAHEDDALRTEFAESWQRPEKLVYSRTLAEPRSARTRIERSFDPTVVNRLKVDADRDIFVGGPELAAQAVKVGLVDEIQLMLRPVVVGGGKRFLPAGVRLDLDLVEMKRFQDSTVFIRYTVRPGQRQLF